MQWWSLQSQVSFLQEEKKMMISEIAKIQKYSFENCQRENLVRKKMMLLEQDCSLFVSEDEEISYSMTDEFLEIFHSLFVDTDFSDEITKTFLQKFSGISEKTLFTHNDFEETFAQDFLQKYVQSFGFSLEQGHDFAEKILKHNGETVGKILWRSDKNEAFFVQEKNGKIFPFSHFSLRKNEVENEIFAKQQADFLEKLSKQNASSLPSENILLLGSNENNTDTIMLLRIFHDTKKMVLFSVPRDLWVDGRKLNAWNRTFGKKIFVQKMENLLGQEISGTVEVSMEAFPKIIDTLGGIDVEFSTPLFDPSYKTQDNGKVGTLYFAKGKHHLSGIEALRMARSRHTTSDFSRAERQQKIVASMKESFKKNSSFSTFSRLGNIVFQHLETDVSLSRGLFLAWEMKNYQLVTTPSMSTKNILVSEMLDVGQGKKAYILLPKNNNWNLLRQFVQPSP